MNAISAPVFVVAIITWLLAGLREHNINKREITKERVNELKQIYAQTISLLEQAIRFTKSSEDVEEFDQKVSENNAFLRLISTTEINEQLEEVSDLMYAWSSNYKMGQPKKVKDTDVSIISSQDSQYKKSAEDLYPKLNSEIIKLVDLMKSHIKNEEKT